MKNWFNKHTKQSRFISSGPKFHGASHPEIKGETTISKDGRYSVDPTTGEHLGIVNQSANEGSGGIYLPKEKHVDLAKKSEGKLYSRVDKDVERSKEGYEGKDKVGFIFNGASIVGFRNPEGTYEHNVRGSKRKQKEFMKRNQQTIDKFNRRNKSIIDTRDKSAGYTGTNFKKEEDS